MFFNKKKEKSERVLGWENDFTTQKLWVQVDKWDYKISVESFKPYRISFQFEGFAKKPNGLSGLPVWGDIEIPQKYLNQDLYSEQKEKKWMRKDCGRLNFIGGESSNHSLSIDLSVRPELYSELFKVFSGICGNKDGGIGIQFHLRHPERGSEPNFWRIEWQKESSILISGFDVHCSGSVPFNLTKLLEKMVGLS